MWRKIAKQASSMKLKFSSDKLSQNSNFLEKIRPPETQTPLNSLYPFLGFRRIGLLSSQNHNLATPNSIFLTNPFVVSPFFKGYASVAEAIASSDPESELSGSEEIQELIEEMRKEEGKLDSYLKQPKKMVAGIGVTKYHMLKKRQVKMETEAWEEAAKEYQELLMDMCEQKLAPNLPYIKSLFLGWFEPLKDAIANDQQKCQEKNFRVAYEPYIDQLPADMMAVIIMHKMMALLMTNTGGVGSVRVVQAACQIGEAIEHEVGKL